MRICASTVMEHVDTFIYETGNHFLFLETVAEGCHAGGTPEATLGALPEDDPR